MEDLSKKDTNNYELLAQLLNFLDSALYTLDDLIEDSETPEHIKRMMRARQNIYTSYNSLAPIVHQTF